jgi:hypothetical protein
MMKRLWNALFQPNMSVLLPMIFINLGAQVLDAVSGLHTNYFYLNGLITIGYLGGVAITCWYGPPGE